MGRALRHWAVIALWACAAGAAHGDGPGWDAGRTGAIGGRIVGCSSGNMENAAVYVPGHALYVKPDGDGAFRFDAVPPGAYSLAFDVGGHVLYRTTVQVRRNALTDAGMIDFTALYACPAEYDPVCGSDGVTYPNGCAAGQACARIAHGGPC